VHPRGFAAVAVSVKRLLTIGHSYVVALNRRLAHELALQGAGDWEVTAAAPSSFAGDLRRITLEPIEAEACRVVPLTVHLDRHPHVMFYGRGLRRILDEPWDLIHCWEEPYVTAGAQIARLSPRGARFVFASFQNLRKNYPLPLSWMERRVVGRADGWIAFGRTVLETHATRDGYRTLRSAVISPGVDTIRFRPDPDTRARVRVRLGWDEEVPVAGFAGRFVTAKGTDVLASTLEALTPPWRALFVGGGPELPALEAFAAAHPGQVRIVTDAAHNEMPAYLNAMDVLCAPSQTTSAWREQFGRMLIEAMASGVPILASVSGEIPHVVGDAGVLLPEGDVNAWRTALGALLKDRGRRHALAALGLDRARTRYAWPVVARQHLQFFDEIMQMKNVEGRM
jgi:glycosyltransferase involved in cell wall biosynthesis